MTYWWDNKGDQILFCRGIKACIAFNNDPVATMNEYILTPLPAGIYCDILTGDIDENNVCTGRTIAIGTDNKAHINIQANIMDSMVAFHIGM